MKKSFSMVIALILIAATVVMAAAATELLTNGDFADGTNDWNAVGGNAVINGVGSLCGDEVVRVFNSSAGVFSPAIQQCVPAPAGVTSWTLSGDLRLVTGDDVGIQADFHASTDCSDSTPLHIEDLPGTTTPTGSLVSQTNAFTYDSGGAAQSIVVTASVVGTSPTACFDNISLIAGDPSAVTLGTINAQSPAAPWMVVIAIGAGLLLTAFWLLLRLRKPVAA